jgi:probable phosphoglycerate mutase
VTTTTQLVLVRHGESRWNTEGRWQGHLDSDLSETGLAQAEAVAGRLARERFDAIYTSDLGRAAQTAEAIARAIGLEVVPDPRLRERHLGIFQGLTWDQIKAQHPNDARAYKDGGPDYVVPGGESARQRHSRIAACVTEIAARHAGRRIVVVSHAGALQTMMREALAIPLESPRRFRLWNASINRFRYEDGAWTLDSWGETSHLAATRTMDDRF